MSHATFLYFVLSTHFDDFEFYLKRSKSLAEVSQSQSRSIIDTANLVGLLSQFRALQALSKFFDVLFQSKDCVR